MKKVIISLSLVLAMAVSFSAQGAEFHDVPSGSEYYEAISALSSQGIITGYSNGTFLPDNTITRAEAAAIIARASGLTSMPVYEARFADVGYEHWAFENIAQVADAGIINGMGDGLFLPGNNLTYYQIIKMAVCMMGKEALATERGGWPSGYMEAALYSGIVDTAMANDLTYNNRGNYPATRGDVARIIYKALLSGNVSRSLKVGAGEFTIGMSADELGMADEVLPSVEGVDWYLYGTDTYENFYAAAVLEGRVVALASGGPGFTYKGMKAGEHSAGRDEYTRNRESVYVDNNDGGKIHAVLIRGNYVSNKNITWETVAAESKMNFHFTNAFRVLHGLSPLIWDDTAADTAGTHSRDMAENNYFSHTSPDGRSSADRMTEKGIAWTGCGENIAAGHATGFGAYNAWVNSSGHRGNMLGNFTHLGVGGGYNPDTDYGYYFTQNFYR